jgi:hypothetical protein
MKEPTFKTEAALCAAFISWAAKNGVQCFAEWAGWDILVVLPDGFQIGIQAKLRLNAEVIGQAAPNSFELAREYPGPDYRAVLVPGSGPLLGIAYRLGLIVFRPHYKGAKDFSPDLNVRGDWRDGHWLDWNPAKRHEIPATPTDSIAGSPCPVTLTRWKLGALDVLAELAVKGTITAKRIRAIGIDPGRWTTYRWLEPGEKRGDWVRSEKCPKFDEQHPTAYALALEKARAAVDGQEATA